MEFTDRKDSKHYYFIVRVDQLTTGLPLTINPRNPVTDKPLARKIRATLESGENNFLEKNLGITLIASGVNIVRNKKLAEINFGTIPENKNEKGKHPYGLANGGHTHRIIMESWENAHITLREQLQKQFISVRVIVNSKPTEAVALAGALNTSMDVDEESLANLAGNFDWIKEALGPKLEQRIIWHQGDGGNLGVPYLFNLLMCMHPGKFPVSHDPDDPDVDIAKHPNKVYSSKAAARKEYEAKPTSDRESLKRLVPLAKDVLELRDYIQIKAFDMVEPKYLKPNPPVVLFERAKPKLGKYFVSNEYYEKESEHILHRASLYPILASYRCLIRDGNKYSWKVQGGLAGAKDHFVDKLLGKQLKELIDLVSSNWRNASPTQWGKELYVWDRMYNIVSNFYDGQKF